jgi:streptogramin lyase
MANLKYYTPTAQPAGLASESTNVLWFTEQGAQGAIGRFTYTSPVSTRFDTFALPETGLRPTGIAVAQDKGVWFAAFTPVRTFLPLVMKNF